jgi:hypothetical protein
MSITAGITKGKFIVLKDISFKDKKTINVCNNKSCKNYKKEQDGFFCSNCGNKLKQKEKEVEKDTYEYLREEISSDDFYIPYRTKIIIVDGMYDGTIEAYKIIDTSIQKEENKIFKKIKEILDKKGIPYQIEEGVFLQIS